MSLLLRRAASSIGRPSAAFRVVGRALLPTAPPTAAAAAAAAAASRGTAPLLLGAKRLAGVAGSAIAVAGSAAGLRAILAPPAPVLCEAAPTASEGAEDDAEPLQVRVHTHPASVLSAAWAALCAPCLPCC
jgi:hypothetical protein